MLSNPLSRFVNNKITRVMSSYSLLSYELDGLTQSINLSQATADTGDYEIELYAETVNSPSSVQGFIGEGVSGSLLYQDSGATNVVRYKIRKTDASFGYVSVANTPVGINLVTVKRVGGAVTLTVAGVSSVSTTALYVGASHNFNSLSNPVKAGVVYGLKYWTGGDRSTGTLTLDLPLTQYPHSVQIPTVPALGANLYTQAVIENPYLAQSQWSYIGDGRWQVISDGTGSVLQFLVTGDQPNSGVVEFEIESISGSLAVCANVSKTVTAAGKYRYYYSSLTEIQNVSFKRASGPVTAIIKNIRHCNAAGIPIATIVNYTAGGWIEQ